MRVLGLDIGSKRIGVAVSDELGITAQPVEVVERDGGEIARLGEIAARFGARKVVVGNPVRLDGTEGKAVEEVSSLRRRIESDLGVEVIAWDERMTTVMAERALIEGRVRRRDRRKVIDKVAAVLILQSYLAAVSPEPEEE